MSADRRSPSPDADPSAGFRRWTSCSRAITLGSRPALTVLAVIACRALLAKNQRMMCLTQDPCVRNVEWRCRVQGLGVRCHLLSGRHIPATWLLMLFAGNVGLHQSYWGTLPLGILVSVLLAGVTKPSVAVIQRDRV
jgi:hypothetical protein